MNGIISSSLKLYLSTGLISGVVRNVKGKPNSRFFSMVRNCLKSVDNVSQISLPILNSQYFKINYYSTERNEEIELAGFLDQEIRAEEEYRKLKTIPSKINDFDVKLNGPEVTLIKQLPEETIKINFNINHSIENVSDDNETEIKCKPSFVITIKKGETCLSFSCSFFDDDDQNSSEDNPDEEINDIFTIDEISIYQGEKKDTDYAVSGHVLDGCLYDLLLNFLEEKGITNELVNQISDFSTAYEHSSYISLLRELKKFA